MKKKELIIKKPNDFIKNIDGYLVEAQEDMQKYADEHTNTKLDKYGNEENVIDYNPIVVTEKYFKPIFDDFSFVPEYNYQELSVLYKYYNEMLTKVNDIIGFFPSSLSLFCNFICVPMNTFKELRNSQDTLLANVVNRIFDSIEENNMTLSQLGMAKERTTLFKLKSQNEVVEKTTPNVNISIKKTIDTKKIAGTIDEYSDYLEKYGK